jgi:UDP-glucose 4-epimerase
MKYLITGGCGFIGSNLTKILLEEGHVVTVIDNLSSDAHDQFYYESGADYYKHNITDYVMCSEVFNRTKPDVVIHLAAEVSIQNSIKDPILCIETNVLGTQTILQLSRRYGVKRVVFMSTSAVYGLKANPIQKETDATDCLNPYSLSKRFGEELCGMYSRDYGVDTVCFRGFNIWGPRQPKRGSYAPVMGVFTRQREEGVPLTIIGDGEQRRDFVHVEDVCRALITGAESLEQQHAEVYNIGTGKNYSVNQIAEMIGGERTYLPPRQGESRSTLADISKIQEKLGWNPKHSLESVYIK